MLRIYRWLSALFIFLFIWIYALLVSRKWGDELDNYKFLVKVFPLYVLVCFGSYSLGSISINIMKVRECPEAAKELDGQIREARRDLKDKGLKF